MKKIVVAAIIVILVISISAAFYLSKDRTDGTPPQGNTITVEELKAEMKSLENINAYPNNKNINPEDYPIVLGRYSENGLTLIKRYFCSDVCPDYGGVSIVFQNITSKEGCAQAGGTDLIDPAWHGYIGCAPKID